MDILINFIKSFIGCLFYLWIIEIIMFWRMNNYKIIAGNIVLINKKKEKFRIFISTLIVLGLPLILIFILTRL